MGVTDDAIDVYLADEAKAKGEPAQTESGIEVLAENWDAVRVYVVCIWETRTHLLMSQMGAQSRMEFVGIRNQEIEATARMLKVDADESLLMRIRKLVEVAKEVLNKVD